jgi:drug/metabolite transporter (DMT)-like permease
MRKVEILGNLSVVGGAILMGTVGVFIRNIHLAPLHLAFFRFLFGFIFLSIIFITGRRKLRFDNLKLLFLIAVINVVVITAYITSVQLIPLGMAALLLYLAPVYVIAIAYLMGEKIGSRVLISIPISISGLFLMLMPSGGMNEGIFFGLISGLFYAFYFFAIKRVRKTMESLEITLGYLAISSLILSPSLVIPFTISPSDILWIVGIGLIPTAVAFTLFNYGLKYCKITEGPVVALVEPVSAGVFGFLFFGEVFSQMQILGMILVLAGIGIAIKKVG